MNSSLTTFKVQGGIQHIECDRAELAKKLTEVLSTIANELDNTLLKNVRSSQYEQVIQEITAVKRRGRRVHFLGIGKSYSIGRALAYIFSNLGIDSSSCELTGADCENLTNLRADDLVMLISNSGYAAEVLQLVRSIHHNGCSTVALTGDCHSLLAKQCTYLINTHVSCNPHPIREAPTTSTTSALAAGTAVGIIVSYFFDYSREDFYRHHPGLENVVDLPPEGIRADTSFDWLTKVEDIFRRLANAIRGLLNPADDFVAKMIFIAKRILISHYNGRPIFIAGAGVSLRVAEKIAATLTSIGIDASAINPAQLLHGDFARIHRGDLLVIISFSGQTVQLLNICKLARQKGIDCAAITAHPESALARECQGEFCLIAGKGADDADLVPVPDQKILSSFINLSVGDALAVILTDILGTTREQFATDAHPGGEIGRRQSRLPEPFLENLSDDIARNFTKADTLIEINRDLAVQVDTRHLQSYLTRNLTTSTVAPGIMIFGMGPIALAYLAPLLNKLGKIIWFVERDEGRIKAMQQAEYRYLIQPTGARSKLGSERLIGRISVISSSDLVSITAHALQIDTIFTAVGVTNVESLLSTLASIVRYRYQFRVETPLNVVFCENFSVQQDPLGRLRHQLRELLRDAELKVYFDTHIGLVPAIDEAIVPEVSLKSLSQPLVIEDEPARLYIDSTVWCGTPLDLGKHVVFAERFLPLHMRKLWVHNMAHALTGYLGYSLGYELMEDAVHDPDIEQLAKRAMHAIAHELFRRWSYHETEQNTVSGYINWRWRRYQNKALNDRVLRVCREPKRKLKKEDRLIGAVNFVRRYAIPGLATDNALADILVGVVAAMKYAYLTEGTEYHSLRSQVLEELVNVDSELLNRAERRFDEFRMGAEKRRVNSGVPFGKA